MQEEQMFLFTICILHHDMTGLVTLQPQLFERHIK